MEAISLSDDLEPVVSATMADIVETRLLEYLKKKSFKPGDALPKEIELAKALGVSRNVLREALSRLRVPEAKSGRSIESLKREILHVSKPANTNILEIQATLRDPRAAQALAQEVAERTVALRGQLDGKSQDDVTAEAGRTLAAARVRMQRAQAALDAFIASDPIEALEEEASNSAELIFRLRRDLSSERAGVAEYEARKQQPGATADARWIEGEITAARARVRQLDAQDRELTRAAEANARILEDRKNRREVLESELRAARGEYEAANTKLNDIRASAMFRGERLQVIDPGIVPRKPSSPNLLLNITAALLIALVVSVLYLSVQFSSARARLLREDRAYVAR
jgi:capsule polysaccharide export protein KpsE/RkpR